jgi:hypothetical protein
MKKSKKLGVIDLGISNRFEVLSDFEKSKIIAGDGEPSWDCLFNSFIHYYKEVTGKTLDKESLVYEYTYKSGQCPPCDGGTDINSFISFVDKCYNVSGTQSSSPSGYGSLMVVKSDDSEISHVVNLLSAEMRRIEDGYSYTVYCWDATLQQYVNYDINQVGNYPGYDTFYNTYVEKFINLQYNASEEYGYNGGYGYNGYGYNESGEYGYGYYGYNAYGYYGYNWYY